MARMKIFMFLTCLLIPFQVYGEEKGGDALSQFEVNSDVEIGDTLFSFTPSSTIEFWDDEEVARITWTPEKVDVVYAEGVTPTEAAKLFFKSLNEMYPYLIMDACKKRPECGCTTDPLAQADQDDRDGHDGVE